MTASSGYLEATRQRRDAIRKRHLFDIFPDNPDDEQPTGVRNLRQSLQDVLATTRSQKMRVQRYDVRDTISRRGAWIEKYWSPSNHPIVAPGGSKIIYVVHQVEDVTPVVRLGQMPSAERMLHEALSLRTSGRIEQLKAQTREFERCRESFVGALERLQRLRFSSFGEIDGAMIELESRMRQIQQDLDWQKPYLDAGMQGLTGTPPANRRALLAAKRVLREMRALAKRLPAYDAD